MGILNQTICTLIGCFLCFIFGLSYPWPSIKLLPHKDMTLERPMGPTERALFDNLFSIGILIGTPVIGMFLDIIGRKYTAMAAGLMNLLAWIIIATCVKVEAILVAIFLSGVSGAVVLVVLVYVGEICQKSIRGTMTASPMIFYSIGMLASLILKCNWEYEPMMYFCLSLSILGFIMPLCLRETPLYLMKKGLDKEAQKSFAFYRNAAFDSNIVLHEMNTLRRAFNPVMDDEEEIHTSEEKYLVNVELQKPEKLAFIRFIRKSRSTRRAMIITVFLMTAAMLQKSVEFQMLSEPLFRQALNAIFNTFSVTFYAFTPIVVGFIGGCMTDFCGRRPLMIYAPTSAGICCLILGIFLGSQSYIQWSPQWLTAALIYLYVTMLSLGAATVPFVFLAEVFLPEVRSLMTMMAVEWMWLCQFSMLFIVNDLATWIGHAPFMYLIAVVCVLSAGFSKMYQPETKGMAVDKIQDTFLNKP